MTKYVVWCESCGDLEETIIERIARDTATEHRYEEQHEVHIEEDD